MSALVSNSEPPEYKQDFRSYATVTYDYPPVLLNHLGQTESPWFGTGQEHWQCENKTSVSNYQCNYSTTFACERG